MTRPAESYLYKLGDTSVFRRYAFITSVAVRPVRQLPFGGIISYHSQVVQKPSMLH